MVAGVCGFHAPLSTTGSKAKPGNPLRVAVYNGADDPGIQPESAHAFKACPLPDRPCSTMLWWQACKQACVMLQHSPTSAAAAG